MMNKPYAESCDQNRDAILSIIQPLMQSSRQVLEIGSGTGQHAVYFASHLPHLVWHTSDRTEYHEGIRLWLAESASDNIVEPIVLDVSHSSWPARQFDCIFSANTLHIMHWSDVEAMFDGIGKVLEKDGKLLVYGPFNYGGQYTSESNRQFDQWLKSRDVHSGIRDIDDLQVLAKQAGLTLMNDFDMPANNRILYWRKC